MVINREFNRPHNINTLIQRILEAGLFTKWHSKHKRVFGDRSVDFGAPSIHIEQLLAPICFMLVAGWILSIATFISERIVERKLRARNASRIWVYLEHFFDGKRHYLTNLPERLSNSRN